MASELDASNTGVLYDLSQDLPPGATRHFYNGRDNDSATAKLIVGAPGTGRRLILTHISVDTFSAQSISILDGGATTLFGPVQLEATSIIYSQDFKWGLRLTANTDMYVDSNSDALYHIYIEYIDAGVAPWRAPRG